MDDRYLLGGKLQQENVVLSDLLRRKVDRQTAEYVISKIRLVLEVKVTAKLSGLLMDIEKGFDTIDEQCGLTKTEKILRKSILAAHRDVIEDITKEIRETLSVKR